MSFQQITVVGRLGNDPQLNYLPDGKAVCNFDVAANPYKDKTIWHRIAVWGSMAEVCHTHLAKGRQVMVIGTVEARGYVNNAGEAAASLELRAKDVRFMGGGARETTPYDNEPADGDIPF